jgi:hypothetical protein
MSENEHLWANPPLEAPSLGDSPRVLAMLGKAAHAATTCHDASNNRLAPLHGSLEGRERHR